jgi:hypothetical protein
MRHARTAVAFFDWNVGRNRNTPGAWKAVVKTPNLVKATIHPTEREAHRTIGLESGSTDPAYRPPEGYTNMVQRLPVDGNAR